VLGCFGGKLGRFCGLLRTCVPCYCGYQSFVLLEDSCALVLILGHLESWFLLGLIHEMSDFAYETTTMLDMEWFCGQPCLPYFSFSNLRSVCDLRHFVGFLCSSGIVGLLGLILKGFVSRRAHYMLFFMVLFQLGEWFATGLWIFSGLLDLCSHIHQRSRSHIDFRHGSIIWANDAV
jgi:hypothetical protein